VAYLNGSLIRFFAGAGLFALIFFEANQIAVELFRCVIRCRSSSCIQQKREWTSFRWNRSILPSLPVRKPDLETIISSLDAHKHLRATMTACSWRAGWRSLLIRAYEDQQRPRNS